MVQYYLGVHRPHWLALSPYALFVSHHQLRNRRSLPRARAPWALDSGGFTELQRCGGWRQSVASYVRAVRRYSDEIGSLTFAAPQDWMCEPEKRARTGLTVEEHQRRTLHNYLELMSAAPELPWIPVLQGWLRGEHYRHLEMYDQAGVDLARLTRVGVGTVCKRAAPLTLAVILGELAAAGLRLHAFGLSARALPLVSRYITSADSTAWSAGKRHEAVRARAYRPDLPRTGGQNSFDAAEEWLVYTVGARTEVEQPVCAAAETPPARQLTLF